MRIFKEEQRFRQWWLIALILVSMSLPIVSIISTYTKDANALSPIGLISTLCAIILVASIIFLFKLSTRIDEKGIHYKFTPFHWTYKGISWQEIYTVYVRTYNPIIDYGGWGFKGGMLWNRHKGKAFNVSGNIGIQLELKNGKKLLIGTQKENEAKKVLETYKHKINKAS